MCDPLAITMAAVSIAKTTVTAVDQNNQNKKNRAASKTAFALENRDISLRALQERIIAAQESVAVNRGAAEASGTTVAGAAAGNVGGMTVDLLLQDIENSRLETLDRVDQQTTATLGALDRQRMSAAATARNRANQTAPANPLGIGLGIAGAGLDSYAGFIARRPPVTPRS